MKTEQLSDLESCIYSYLDSRINTHIDHLELVFDQYESTRIKNALNKLVEHNLIFVVKTVDDKPIYSTESKRDLQTPYP